MLKIVECGDRMATDFYAFFFLSRFLVCVRLLNGGLWAYCFVFRL